MDRATLLTELIGDFKKLRLAYQRCGLLRNGDQPGQMAWKLLGGRDEIDRFGRDFLLADALIRNRIGNAVLGGGAVHHVAVFGGNNVGKSTIVNILRKNAGASTSPEGGHTRTAQVFVGHPEDLFGCNQYAFESFSALATPAPGRLDCYAVFQTDDVSLPTDIALWDTPDCDAIGSDSYLEAVVETVTTADLLIYVTSVEKYSVAHLVEWLFQLNEAGITILECLNKTPKRDREAVIRRQGELFSVMSRRLGLPAPTPALVALRNMTEGEESDLWGAEHPEADELRAGAFGQARNTDRTAGARQAASFVQHGLARLLEPVAMERDARQEWAAAVADLTANFVLSYQKGYLSSSTVIEPFTRLNVEVLALLDPNIPGLRQVTQGIRWATRWPSKLLLIAGRRAFKLAFENGDEQANGKLPPELKIYSDAHGYLLDTLGWRIEDCKTAPKHHPYWDMLASDWQNELKRLADRFGEVAHEQMRQTETEIRKAARDIVDKIKENPTLLNVLRSVRVLADIGGAMAGFLLPDGGIAVDLIEEAIVAPLMLTGAEAASKAMAARYVLDRKSAVVERLKANARDMADTLYTKPLLAMGEDQMARMPLLDIDQALLDGLPKKIAAIAAALS